MEATIIMPHRPFSHGGLSTGKGPLYQLPDGRWQEGDIPPFPEDHYREDIHRGIQLLRRNSIYNHKILIATDPDVYPQDWWLKEYAGVSIIKSNFYLTGREEGPGPYYRLCGAYISAIESIPDDEWLCYGYTSDLICSKEWDKYIKEAIEQGGDDKVYIPLFVEVRGGGGGGDCGNIEGWEPTPELIWNHWRQYICCHALTYPVPTKGYITEEDFGNYIRIANQAEKPNITEMCGERNYGYYDIMFMKAKRAKAAIPDIRGLGMGFDLEFDNALGRLGLPKVVVTKSFILHHQTIPFRWERFGGNYQNQP